MRSLSLACFVWLMAACSAESSAPGGSGGSSNQAGAGGEPTGLRSLTFDEIPRLAAREQVTLRVQAKPAGVYRVRFSLPTANGDPLDAILDRSEGESDSSGAAEVVLTAPSATAEFDVRASVDGVLSTELRVSVKDTGFTTVHVQPKYTDPSRNIVTWTATVHPNASCAELSGIPPEDGPITALAPNDAAPTVSDVPALTPLAITLRSGHFVGGCASVEMLSAGGEHTVEVTVLNRPIDLSESRLSLSLGLAEVAPAWQDFLLSAEQAAIQALPGNSTGDVDALLDAMRVAAGESQQALETARKTEGWDALVAARWGDAADTRISTTLSGWLSAGRSRLLPGDHVIQGIVNAPSQRDAELDLLTVAGLPAARAGFTSPARIAWSASADDQVHISSDIYLVASRFATSLAEAAVRELNEEAKSASDALAQALDCEGVTAALTGAGADSTRAYLDCDGACLEKLCEKAAATLWERARDATALAPARLLLSASGKAYVGDIAEVASINATWIGSLVQGQSSASTSGSLKAATAKE